MSKINIEQLRALPDYATLTKWDVTFATLPAVGGLGVVASDSLNARCESVDLPKPTNQKIMIETRGHKTIQAGTNDLGNSTTLVFHETVDNSILKFITAWAEVCRAFRDGKSFSKADSEATIVITQYDNNNKARCIWTMYGCLWESDDFGALDSSSSDIQRPSLTIGFDYFKRTPLV